MEFGLFKSTERFESKAFTPFELSWPSSSRIVAAKFDRKQKNEGGMCDFKEPIILTGIVNMRCNGTPSLSAQWT
jgi:hypothetical protein